MKVAVIGATGGVGQKVVEQSLEKGFEVIAVARNPQALSISDKRLEWRKGNVLDEESIKQAIAGAEIVVSAIGTNNPRHPIEFYSGGITNIIKAMKLLDIKRIAAIASNGYIAHERETLLFRLLKKYILQKIFRYTYEDLMRMEGVIRESNLDWTIVRPPKLTNGKHTGKYRVETEPVDGGLTISRADVADFIVNHLTDERTFQKAIGVGY